MVYSDLEADSFGRSEEGGDGSPSGMARAWHSHMGGLKATYHRLIASNMALVDQRIEILLNPNVSADPKNATNWAIPNEIEILLARLYPPAELAAELESALATADRIAVPSREGLRKRAETAALPDEKQAVLATLLRDTHNRYAARRSERVARRIVAMRLAWLGLSLTVLIAIVVFALGYGYEYIDRTGETQRMGYHTLAKYNLAVGVFFGFLGAYLSRLIAFQNGAPNLSFDDLENGYARHFIFVRLLVGGLCALVVYFIIAGRLIGGELFPEAEAGAAGGFGPLWLVFDDSSYTGPSANFAKLIVWCFIAGFSERFLPDHLTALEAKSKS